MKKSFFLFLIINSAFIFSCGSPSPGTSTPSPSASPSSATNTPVSVTSRDKFLGDWKNGSYSCGIGSTIDNDTIKIEAGAGQNDVKITVFESITQPSVINGSLNDDKTIDIPSQQLNGAATSGKIVFEDSKQLTLSFKASFADCKGTGYTK